MAASDNAADSGIETTTGHGLEPQPQKPKRDFLRLGLTLGIVLIAGGYLAFSTAGGSADTAYYYELDEVMADTAKMRGKRLKVVGFVADNSIQNIPGTAKYKFTIVTKDPRPPAKITAYYEGIVADTFKSGAQVVAEGSLTAANEFKATKIMAKCPSKYDAEEKMELTSLEN